LKAFRFTLALAIVILILSVISVPKLPEIKVRAVDKWGHLLAYLSLSFTLFFELAKKHHWSNTYRRWLIPSIAICIIYGILMELLQATPLFDRHFEYNDMVANSIGVGLGLALFVVTSGWIKKLYIK
jgi:VanZ family protein